MSNNHEIFNENCTQCARLSSFLSQIRQKYPEYYSKPVPSFGSDRPDLLIVGLAPGLHGANATGRPFTGDYAGILLYEMLHKHGFSNKPASSNTNDNLKLKKCRITNAVRCLPPENKPIGDEIKNCNRYLREELNNIEARAIILCLGVIAHKATVKALLLKQSDYQFKHGNIFKLSDGRTIIDSYHCSKYNIHTKRLTKKMFNDIFKNIKKINK